MIICCHAADKFEIMALGDLKDPKDSTHIAIFKEAVKDLNIQYAINTPSAPLVDKLDGCNYHITYMYIVDKDNKTITIHLSFTEMEGTNNFELNYSKSTENYSDDGKKIILTLMKIALGNISIFKELR